VFLFLYGLDAGPLYRTEALRAVIGRECLHGHWLYPVLYGEPFLTKPPGHYAAIGLCSLAFGEVSAATARLPSVFAATLAVLLMHGLFRRVLGGPAQRNMDVPAGTAESSERAALLMALLLPCSVLWLDKVPSAEIDMTLVGWVTAALVLFFFSLPVQGPQSLGWLVGALLCVVGGTLTKWTAPAFFYLTVIPLLIWRRQFALLFGWRHLLAVGVAGAACALWAAAVVQQVGWDALSETIRKEVAYRFAPKASKGYPWGDVLAYPLAVFAAHLPVSAFALLTFRRSFWAQWDDRGRLLLQFLHCWTWPNLLFWTLVPNHNVRYALPMSAGLMGLGVMGLLSLVSREPKVRAAPAPVVVGSRQK
jgi:4-amino-4-deoxy-L-arabinose transferase-like glycosyltransferase